MARITGLEQSGKEGETPVFGVLEVEGPGHRVG